MQGEKISILNGVLQVPNHPVVPFIEGDGTGPDIWAASVRVVDAAVEIAYGGKRKIEWLKVLAGQEAFDKTGSWLPEETMAAFREYLVGIKGPLTTPVGGGIRSLNVALRQELDLYVCLRPVEYFTGTPSPVKEPEKVNMVIFRENSEDIYAGIEFQEGTDDAKKMLALLKEHFPAKFGKIRFPESTGLGLKPASKEGTRRLFKAAMEYAIRHKRNSVTIVHKGNIMKYTEGAFMEWSYEMARTDFGGTLIDGGPWTKVVTKDGHEIVIKDVIADAFLQQILLRPSEYDVIACMNLNGDYISDALAAQIGGIGIAPGANINYVNGAAIFEATHGTAPKYAGLDKVNPGSVILSAAMMLEYMGWIEAKNLIHSGLGKAISSKRVTYDFERLMSGATLLKCSEFGDEIIKNMK